MTPETFCEQFATFAEAPNGVAKLRELILQLAVQGKLGTQDVNDEPASISQRDDQSREGEAPAEPRTAKRRQSSISARQEPRPPDPDDTSTIAADLGVPFALPSSWRWVRLGDVITDGPRNGFSPKPVQQVTRTKSLTLSATTSGTFNGRHVKYLDEEIPPDSHLWLNDGDILIQRSNSEHYVGIAAVYRGRSHEFVYPDLMMKIRVAPSTDVSFAHLILNSPPSRSFFRAMATGTSGSMRKVNKTVVTSLPFPLPPLAEQRRIVGKVDQLLGLCDELAARQVARREARTALVGATLDRLVSFGREGEAPAEPRATNNSPRAARQEPRPPKSSAEFPAHAHRLRDHFDRLFDTPTTLPQLRQAILQLAVQGQLVPQDPNDEPVETFLQANDQERLRRLESGTIRTKTSNDADTVKQSLDEVPHGWKRRPLIELSQFIDYRGKTPTRTPAGVRLITAKNVRMGSVENEPVEFVTEKQYEQWMTRGFPEIGDLLFVTEGHTMGFVGMLNLQFRFALAQRTINLHPFVKDFNKYLHFYLMSPRFQSDVVSNSTGSAAKGIKASKLKQLLIAVPPLSEQKRIVSKVTELLSRCR